AGTAALPRGTSHAGPGGASAGERRAGGPAPQAGKGPGRSGGGAPPGGDPPAPGPPGGWPASATGGGARVGGRGAAGRGGGRVWVGGGGVGGSVVAALDDWAVVAEESRSWLLAVARRAAPDPWGDQLRDPAVWRDPRALQTLADEALRDDGAKLGELSPQVL